MPEPLKTGNLHLRSEVVQEILTDPPAWIVRWGITLVFVFTCIILALSFIIKYPDFVTAKVLITTQEPTEKVVSRHSGPLETLFVESGDTVNVGQILAVIRNTADFRDIFLLKKIIDSLPDISDTFQFPIARCSRLSLGDIEVAYIGFEKDYINYRLLQDLNPYATMLKGNQQSLTEIRKQLEAQVRQKSLLNREYELKQTDFHRYRALFEKGVISQKEFETKELEIIQIQKNISAMAISISQMREAISSADQTLRTTYIDREEDQTRLLKNLAQSYNTLKEAIRDWEYQYVLTSSTNGRVSFQEYWGTNQYVQSGEIVFSILPVETGQLVGKLSIASQNAGKVTVGQKVLVKLDNFPYQQYGMLLGKVKSISVSPNSEGNYFIYISLPRGTRTSYDQNLKFDQEMLGNAEIITEDLSIAERLFYRFKELFKYV